MKFDHLIASGVLGGNAAQLLSGVPKNVGGCCASRTPHSNANTPDPLGSRRCPLLSQCFPWRGFHIRHAVYAPMSPLVSLSASMGFDTLPPLPPRSLGREISRRWWCHPCCEGLWGGPLPTGPGVNRARSWVRLAPGRTLLVAWRRWRESPPVGGTSCPPYQRRVVVARLGVWP
jgi:hypothetical protein